MVDRFIIRTVALKWYFFTSASLIVYDEYCHLFMKQLGFTSQQIAVTTLFGVQHLFIPVVFIIGDKFRVRKLLVWIVTIVAMVNCSLPLLPLIVDLPTCFQKSLPNLVSTQILNLNFKNSSASTNKTFLNPEMFFDATLEHNSTVIRQNVPWNSNIFYLMVFSRSLTTFLEGVTQILANIATITHLDEHRDDFGSYFMWLAVGSTVSIVTAAVLAWIIRIAICEQDDYGYFTAFLLASLLVLLSMLSLPWFEFKYEDDRTINWDDVKHVLFDCHYIYIYLMFFYAGVCAAFQIYWEFWYLSMLHASPLVMGGAALIRRPLLAVSCLFSGRVIRKIGDLYAISLAFLLFVISFLALSFTRVFWYVLAIDTLQAIAYGLLYTAFTVHLSKAGTKAISGVVLGKYDLFILISIK